MQADALAQGRPAGRDQLLIQPPEAGLHRQGRPNGRQGLNRITAAAGHAELRHQRIPDELVEQALLGNDGGGDRLEITVEQGEQLGRFQLGAEGGEAHQIGEQHHAAGAAAAHLGPERAGLAQDVAQQRGRDAPGQQLVQVVALPALPPPLAEAAHATPQQRHAHKGRDRQQPATRPAQARQQQPSGGGCQSNRQRGAGIGTATQQQCRQQRPAQQQPRDTRRRQLPLGRALQQAGQCRRLHLSTAQGAIGRFLLIAQLRCRGAEQHGAATPEAFRLLQHLPGGHLRQAAGRARVVDRQRLRRHRAPQGGEGQRRRVGRREVG